MQIQSLWLLLAVLVATCCADSGDNTDEFPVCGLACLGQELPLSVCQSVLNTTCICTDPDFQQALVICVSRNCTGPEALQLSRIEAKSCGRPVRSRRADLLIPLCIEIPGWFAVWLRLYSRWKTMHRFEVDDYIMGVCGILYTVFIILGQWTGMLAFGVDVWTVSGDDLTRALKLFYVDEMFYLVCLCLTKISLLFFFLRIFPQRTFRRAAYLTMGFVVLSNTIILFMVIFQCTPVDRVWEGWKDSVNSSQCLQINTLAYVTGGLGILHDVMILALPMSLLYNLNMSWRSKVGIFVMFSLGAFVLITSCIRMRYIVLFERSTNPTWDHVDALIWSGLEVAVSMIVTSLPAIRVLLTRTMPSIFGSRATRHTGDNSKELTGSSGFKVESRSTMTGSNQREPESRRGMFSIRGNREPNESELELGDKVKGEVQTEIGTNERRDSSIESGIHVHTTTSVSGGAGR